MNRRNDARGAGHKETGDLSLAAYALMNGFRVVRARERRSGGGGACEYSFTFEDPDDRWESLHLAFANSDVSKYDAALRSLKKLCKRNGASP